jgi:predicted kinase
MKQKIIYLRGMQASSKSTWAIELCKNDSSYKRINRDSFREMLNGYQFDKVTEKLISTLEFDTKITLLEEGYNLVIDNMNLNLDKVNEDIENIKSFHPDVEIEIKEFPITLYEAINRDSKRSKSLGESVLKNTYRTHEIELKQMIKRHKPKQIIDENLPWCILVDVDGSLADSTNRKIFDDTQLILDNIIEPVQWILSAVDCKNQAYFDKGNLDKIIKVVIMSGRKESCKEQTVEWLENNNINFDNIFMRSADDNRKDTIVKQELYHTHIKGKYNVEFVIDDRPSVIEMWIKNGLFVLNVNQDPLCKNNF